MKKTFFIMLALIAGATFVWAAGQKEAAPAFNYPTQPIRLVVGWAPGGSSDAMARALSAIAKKYLGQELIVVNRDGAGATIATTEVKTAKPDGYTLQLNAVGVMTTQPVLRQVQYKIEDFDYIASLSNEPIVLMVHTSSPYKSLADLKNAGKTIMLGANAVGSLPYIAALDVMHKAGIKAEAVPMSGGGPSIAALLSKQVDVGAAHPNEAIQHVNNGDLKFIGICSPARNKMFPDVPTFKEQGIDVDYSVWKWIQAPKGVDPAILDFLGKKFDEMKKDPDFIRFAANTKLEIIDMPQSEIKSTLLRQAAATSSAIHNIGTKK